MENDTLIDAVIAAGLVAGLVAKGDMNLMNPEYKRQALKMLKELTRDIRNELYTDKPKGAF